ncbi:rhodanese-like domain-containing protein [Oceanobacillus massiliensis]|uniref:rhodanese-like domain-containing protein n=1 Tax=Oceanobacillus massiliensis TaxID=1465765 RepID=UPI003019FC56
MSIILICLAIYAFVFIYKRYVPALGSSRKYTRSDLLSIDNVQLIDTRDFQTSSKESIADMYRIPVPYLKRHYNEIPHKPIVLIAADSVEVNLAARFLKNKGYQIQGYCLLDYKKKKEMCCCEI